MGIFFIQKIYYLCSVNQFLYTLEQYSRTGHLFKQVHRTLPLSIWNYTPEVQYGQSWDEVTLQCRGLVTDNEGNIVARPYKKFFNIEEGKHTSTEEFDVFEKMDGSLGILFYYEGELLTNEERYNIWFNNNYETGMERFFDPNNLPDFENPYYKPTPKRKGEWIFASRGSFTSDQSKKGRELLEKYNYQRLDTNYTYLFEIIYPENRIVCNYDYEDVVLLGMIHTETGYEVDIHLGNDRDIRFKNLVRNLGFNIVKKYDGIKDYNTLKEMVENNAEGFVVLFSNGDRMKVKGEEYIRLHKIMTNISTTGVWEMVSSGGDVNEHLKDVPDEFYQKVKQYADNLKYAYFQVSEHCGKSYDYFRYGKYGDREIEPTKKEFAEHVMKYSHPPYRAVMFAMWDGKPYEKIIWHIIKPEFKKL